VLLDLRRTNRSTIQEASLPRLSHTARAVPRQEVRVRRDPTDRVDPELPS
jgi:hypothetical protein